MSTSTLTEDKKALWRYKHAQQCFDYVVRTGDHVLREAWPADHPLIYQTTAAAVVIYARPFTQCYGLGKLDERLIPSTLMNRHTKLMALRNKVFAHHDTNEFSDPEMIDFIPEIVLRVFPNGGCTVGISENIFKDVAFDQMRELAAELDKKCTWHIQRIMKKNFANLPNRAGTYVIDMKDASPALFIERSVAR